MVPFWPPVDPSSTNSESAKLPVVLADLKLYVRMVNLNRSRDDILRDMERYFVLAHFQSDNTRMRGGGSDSIGHP